MHTSNSAAKSSAATEIKIKNWRPYIKKTLQGFFSAVLPSGMVLHDLMLHQKDDGSRWIGFPSSEFTNREGLKQYAPYIDFVDKETKQHFQEQVIEALDRELTPAGI